MIQEVNYYLLWKNILCRVRFPNGPLLKAFARPDESVRMGETASTSFICNGFLQQILITVLSNCRVGIARNK